MAGHPNHEWDLYKDQPHAALSRHLSRLQADGVPILHRAAAEGAGVGLRGRKGVGWVGGLGWGGVGVGVGVGWVGCGGWVGGWVGTTHANKARGKLCKYNHPIIHVINVVDFKCF